MWGQLLTVASLACGIVATPQGQAMFRSGVELVNFGVTVVDRKGAVITDLKAEDFEVYEEGRKQTIGYFARGDAGKEFLPPLHLGLLFDTSGSMQEDLRLSRSAAVKFLNTITDAIDITLVDFDTEVRVARYGQADFPRLVERIRNREPEGWTALFDALGVYLDGANGQDGRKILVLYTDGGDTRSAITLSETLDLLKASDVTVYSIGFLEHQLSSVKMGQRQMLTHMAELTGGRAFFPTAIKDLDKVYDSVHEEILAQYSLGYSSLDRRTDGAWRKVEVKVVRPDLKGAKVRARAGYFGPYKPASR
ncbi:MAG: VWA domain-containing protein [Acidobacteria bacterium]|nr:VWA domain-containing protein [Acidobacteriota bacterium]